MAEPAGAMADQSLVVHKDARDAACEAASLSVDQLLWQGSADTAKAVTLFGPGLVVLPLLGRVAGVDEARCLAYSAHPGRAAKGGLMDRVDLETKFGQLDPARLVEELSGGRSRLEARMRAMSNEELRDEVLAFQDWKSHANGRLKTLEKRAAWAFLGISVGTATQAAVKRAFKKRALELHPDKGGDAERFQLLQEMRDLLVVPTQTELEDRNQEQKEKDQEVEQHRAKEKERRKKKQKDEAEREDGSDLSSDDSWDADEELRKMFPKKGRRRKRDAEEDDGQPDVGRDEHLHREKYEAARRKLHRSFNEMWERAGRLVEEIKRNQQPGDSGDALRQLRRFTDRFAAVEVAKLREDDPQKAERIFRRFLEQGSEVICAAGAVDPVAAVSSVAMQLNYPLLSKAPSEALKSRAAALLEAIESLPSICERHVAPVDAGLVARRRAEKEAVEAARGAPVRVNLLVPDAEQPVVRQGVEVPGTSEVSVELPPGSTVDDLRAAALQMCGGRTFGTLPPRLFCRGAFVAAAPGQPLAEVAGLWQALADGCPVQCLPSNRAVPPKQSPVSGASYPTAPRLAGEDSALAPAPVPLAPPSAAAGTVGGRASKELLEALGLAERKAGIVARQQAEPEEELEADQVAEPLSPPSAEAAQGPAPVDPPISNAAEEAGQGKENEDEWFDDFFEKTAVPDPGKMKEEEEEERRKSEEQSRKQAQGQSALEARLQAQRRAAEAKRKVEAERRKQRQAAGPPAAPSEQTSPAFAETAGGGATAGLVQKPQAPPSEALAVVREPVGELVARRCRTYWDPDWEHPCAGAKRPDGKAIFCHSCDAWCDVDEPFCHASFERHCDQVGHYAWID